MRKKIKNNFRLPRPRSAKRGGQTSDLRLRGGFTLLEVLVAISIFLIVITLVVQIFLMGMNATRRLFGRQNALDAARFVLESMSREIRMSSVTSGSGQTSKISIINSKDNCNIDYEFSSGKAITRQVTGGPDPPCERDVAPVDLSSDDVEMTGSFWVGTALTQKRMTVVATVKNKTTDPAQQVQVNLQTTISSRQYAQ